MWIVLSSSLISNLIREWVRIANNTEVALLYLDSAYVHRIIAIYSFGLGSNNSIALQFNSSSLFPSFYVKQFLLNFVFLAPELICPFRSFKTILQLLFIFTFLSFCFYTSSVYWHLSVISFMFHSKKSWKCAKRGRYLFYGYRKAAKAIDMLSKFVIHKWMIGTLEQNTNNDCIHLPDWLHSGVVMRGLEAMLL